MRKCTLVMFVLVCVSLAAAGLDPYDFGQVGVGQSKDVTYTMTNTSLFPCVLEAIGFGGTFQSSSGPFSITPPVLPAEMPVGGGVSWLMRFSPVAVGAASAPLSLRTKCGGLFTTTMELPLLGTGGFSLLGPILEVPLLPPGTVEPGDEPGGCLCTAEILGVQSDIAEVAADVASVMSFLQTQLGPSVYGLTVAVAELEDCGESAAPAPCPGPFPSEGGAKFQWFVAMAKQVTALAAQVLPSIDPEQPGLQALLDAGADVVDPLLAELDQLAATAAGLSAAQKACLDSYVPQESIDFLQASSAVISDPLTHPKLRGLLGSTAEGVIDKVLEKIGIWASEIPFLGSLVDDIRALVQESEDVFGLAGLMFQYELERKLDGIIYGLFGIVIPPNATESELEELLRRITGDSLVDRLGRLEAGLTGVTQGLGDIADEIEAVDERVREIERIVNENADELDDIEKKICCFVLSMRDYTQQMGLALYGDRSAFEFLVPDLCSSVTVSECVSGVYAPMAGDPTFDAIKPEIRALEADMIVVRQQLEEILRRLGGGSPVLLDEEQPTVNGNGPPEQPELTIEEQEFFWLAITKKIYVYAEDTFSATSASDEHEVHVVTPAFDVSGWVDLYELRSGDEVEIEILVNVDGRERSFMTTTFDGDVDARLVYFDELTGGRALIVGDDVKILFRQTASADDFAVLVPIGYQFVVESQL